MSGILILKNKLHIFGFTILSSKSKGIQLYFVASNNVRGKLNSKFVTVSKSRLFCLRGHI